MTVLGFLGIAAVLLLVVVLELVRQRRLRERLAVFWVAFSAGVALAVLFPDAVERVAEALGFGLPANLVFVAGLIMLAFVGIQLSVEVTRLRYLVERITNEFAAATVADPESPDDQADPPSRDVGGS